jgi:hypothetical protein
MTENIITPAGRRYARHTRQLENDSLTAARGLAAGAALGAVGWVLGITVWLLHHWIASHLPIG